MTEDQQSQPKKSQLTEDGNSQKTKEENKQEENMVPQSRFSEVADERNTYKSRVEELESKLQQREKREKEEQQKYKELYEETNQELESYKTQVERERKQSKIVSTASKLGFNDPSDVAQFVDLDNMSDEEVEERVKEVAENKPYLLKQEAAKNIGTQNTSIDESSDTKKKVWAASDLREKMKNHAWWKENQEEVRQARAEGRVDYNK